MMRLSFNLQTMLILNIIPILISNFQLLHSFRKGYHSGTSELVAQYQRRVDQLELALQRKRITIEYLDFFNSEYSCYSFKTKYWTLLVENYCLSHNWSISFPNYCFPGFPNAFVHDDFIPYDILFDEFAADIEPHHREQAEPDAENESGSSMNPLNLGRNHDESESASLAPDTYVDGGLEDLAPQRTSILTGPSREVEC